MSRAERREAERMIREGIFALDGGLAATAYHHHRLVEEGATLAANA